MSPDQQFDASMAAHRAACRDPRACAWCRPPEIVRVVPDFASYDSGPAVPLSDAADLLGRVPVQPWAPEHQASKRVAADRRARRAALPCAAAAALLLAAAWWAAGPTRCTTLVPAGIMCTTIDR